MIRCTLQSLLLLSVLTSSMVLANHSISRAIKANKLGPLSPNYQGSSLRGMSLDKQGSGSSSDSLIGEFEGKFKPTPHKWVALNKDMTFANKSWGADGYNFDDSTTGHKVVFIDPYIERDTDSYANFKKLSKDKHILICYFSAGTYEEYRESTTVWFDADSSRKELWFDPMDDWPDEYWLDISKTDLMKEYIRFQIDQLASFGCHGVEPDNIDCWANSDCVGSNAGSTKWYNYQKTILKYMGEYAHAKGLSIAHKNNGDMIKDLVDLFDCAIAESPFQYNEADIYSPFLSKNKPVFLTEYINEDGGPALSGYCDDSEDKGMFLKYEKSKDWKNCFSAGSFDSSYSYNYGDDYEGDDQESGSDGGAGEGEGEGESGGDDSCACCDCCKECMASKSAGKGASNRGLSIGSDQSVSSQQTTPTSSPGSFHLASSPGSGSSSSKDTSNNGMIVGSAAGAAGAFAITGLGLFIYKHMADKKIDQEMALDSQLHDASNISSYDFN